MSYVSSPTIRIVIVFVIIIVFIIDSHYVRSQHSLGRPPLHLPPSPLVTFGLNICILGWLFKSLRILRHNTRLVCYCWRKFTGDFELILKFDSYLQTTVCTRTTEVFILSQSNFQRVLGLRNGSRILELLLEKSFLRLRCRLSTVNGLERRLPILGTLLKITEEYRNSLLQHPRGPRFDVEERLKELDLRRSRVSNRTMADLYRDYIPSHGLLVDQFGRGTVFDRIRRQEKMRRNQKQKMQESFASASEARVRRRIERAGSLDTASDISNRTIVRKKPSRGKFSDYESSK